MTEEVPSPDLRPYCKTCDATTTLMVIDGLATCMACGTIREEGPLSEEGYQNL